ncbi:MAG: class I SAM-dependent methyltransferase [Pseudomonadota bacterium]
MTIHDPLSLPVAAFSTKELRRTVRLERKRADLIDLFGEPVPEALAWAYPQSAVDRARAAGVQRKYLSREANIARSWNRVQTYLPELIRPGGASDVLEMSTGHGAMLEVLRHLGHTVLGTDYANMVFKLEASPQAQERRIGDTTFVRRVDDAGRSFSDADVVRGPYASIVDAIGIHVRPVDGGAPPYPFADDSFDTVMAFQALDHYCHPADWPKVLDEFCRIARYSVVILLNRLTTELSARSGYADAFDTARTAFRNFDARGFRCVSVKVHYGAALGFKFMRLSDGKDLAGRRRSTF